MIRSSACQPWQPDRPGHAGDGGGPPQLHHATGHDLEQITYLLFIKRLDELQTVEERKAATLGIPIERRIFPEGKDDKGRPYADMRLSRFKSFEPREMFSVIDEHVFPFLRTLGGEGSAFGQHMKDARLGIPTPALLAKAVEKLDGIRMEDRDTKGDVYEYMLSKIAAAGQNGQFRTPRHVIKLMVELTEPKPTDVICDPAVGTCGFLVAAGEYLRAHHPDVMRDPPLRSHNAPDRVDEHDPAWGREPPCGVPGLARRGSCFGCRPLQPRSCQSALC